MSETWEPLGEFKIKVPSGEIMITTSWGGFDDSRVVRNHILADHVATHNADAAHDPIVHAHNMGYDMGYEKGKYESVAALRGAVEEIMDRFVIKRTMTGGGPWTATIANAGDYDNESPEAVFEFMRGWLLKHEAELHALRSPAPGDDLDKIRAMQGHG